MVCLWKRFGVVHAGEGKDVLLYIIVIRFAADDLNQAAKQNKAVVGILHTRHRLKRQCAVPKQRHIVCKLTCLKTTGLILRSEEISSSSSMTKQMAYLHPRSEIVIR